MNKEERLKELVQKGKKSSLNNNELMEMISLLGPKAAINAVKNGNK